MIRGIPKEGWKPNEVVDLPQAQTPRDDQRNP